MNESIPAVEQAVIAVKLGETTNEVALAQTTPNVAEVDVEELLNWAERVELFGGRFDKMNMFFFPTPSGALAIGRLTPDAERPRDSGRFYFQTMLVAPETFYRCCANPPLIYQMALSTTRFAFYSSKSRLRPFRFELDELRHWGEVGETIRTGARVGARALATLTQSVLETTQTSFATDYRAFSVVSSLFALLPIYWRPELTFSVGVKFRGVASIRLIGATVGGAVKNVPYSQMTPQFFDLRDFFDDDFDYPPTNAWATFVETALKTDRVDFINRKILENFFNCRRRDGEQGRETTPEEIAEWGDAWLRELTEETRRKGRDGGACDANVERTEEDSAFWIDKEDYGDEDDSNEYGSGEFCAELNVWKEDEAGADAWKNDERWRIDDSETTDDADFDELRDYSEGKIGDSASSRRGDVDFIFDDELDEIDVEKLSDAFFEKKRNDNSRASDALDAELTRWLQSLCEEIERDENDETDAAVRRDFDDASNGEERVVVSGVFRKGRDLDEAFRRIEKLLKPTQSTQKKKTARSDGDSTARQDENDLAAFADLRSDDAILEDERNEARNGEASTISPLIALRDEFPEEAAALTRCDELIVDGCRGDGEAIRRLEIFWNKFRIGRDEEKLERIREEYCRYLRGVLKAALGGDVVWRVRLTTAALDVCEILSR